MHLHIIANDDLNVFRDVAKIHRKCSEDLPDGIVMDVAIDHEKREL